MLLGLAVFGLLGAVAYKVYWGDSLSSSEGKNLTEKLQKNTDNGFQFRDVTFADKTIDISHPDVRYGNATLQQAKIIGHGPGIYGTPETYYQLIPGTSEISKINSTHLVDHLIL